MRYPLIKDPDWLILGEPRPVQIEALRRSYGGFRAQDSRTAPRVPVRLRDGPATRWGHWLQMRLGKTPVTFAEFSLFERDHGFRNLLIIAPNSYKKDWANEAGKFGMVLPVHVFQTSKSEAADKFVATHRNGWMVVMNHEAMIHGRAIQFVQRNLDAKTMLVIDESIRFKNPSSISTRWMVACAKEAGVVRLLTGLPMTQGPQDLYTQLAMLGATGGRVFHAFRNRYCVMGGFKNKQVTEFKEEEELRDTIDRVAFDAKRLQWADPVHATQSILRTELLPEQRKHYDTMEEEFYAYIEGKDTDVTAMMVVTKLMKLQQITSGFIIDENSEAHELVPPDKVPKVRRLIELIEEEIDDGKIVVPYFYNYSGSLLEKVLARYNPAVIHSQQTMRDRKLDVIQEKARFNNDPNCRVCIVQISAGKYGHDLAGSPGNRTSFMAFYEGTYSLDDREQIEARITAAAQDWPVTYFDFVSSPVEIRPITALQRKINVVTAILGERGRPTFTTFNEGIDRI